MNQRRRLGFDSGGGDNSALLDQIAALQAANTALQADSIENLSTATTRFSYNLAYATTVGVITTAAAASFNAMTRLDYLYIYTGRLATGNFASLFTTTARYLYFYNVDATGGVLPDLVGTNNRVRYLTFDNSNTNGQSFGEAGTTAFPASWSGFTALQRIYFRRNELTHAKQQALIASLEVNVLAGMGSTYNSTHYLYLNNTASGKNDALTQAPLVALGWTAVTSNRLQKTIAGKVWRVEHN